MRAYEAALRDFEAKEAEAKAAVAALNKDNAAKYAAEQAAAKQRHDNAVAAREARIVSDQAAHNAKLRAHREETLRLARQHEAAMAEWRRKTAACLAGDRTQCAPQ
ncbi:MAG: hypothetical protein EAY70_03015 [Sphingomonadales bacterium]|nr:MAG: hypothetical protein EAY70_03015 [Sphingomonadales bacterium]